MFGFVNVVGAALRETTRTVGGAGTGKTSKSQVKRSRTSA
ncbi:hypothetical protein CLV41_108263 [Roseibium marinum]|uniref:Uncharacterized protein n=1 Tax=Roseibium marinum TaxID=281252 RepID=A0A2S3UQ40_9HYPH|nr:hypothetical protein CLV41_108263 [Roseibium marinum]